MDEYSNKDRRTKAQAALETYADHSYAAGMDAEEPATILGDLLCDLRHWAKAQGVNFAKAVKNSKGVFLEECAEEGEK